jgi:hypothetical protein
MAASDGMSQAMADFINRLSPEEKESLLDVLRDSRTYLAEDMTDVIAILKDIKN